MNVEYNEMGYKQAFETIDESTISQYWNHCLTFLNYMKHV